MKRARSSAWRRVCRVSRAMYRAETAVTTASTRSEVARVNLVFRLRRIDPPRLVFFQFVMKCLETNAQQFGRASLVLVCGVQSLQDQLALSCVHGGPYGKAERAEPRIC